MRLIAVALCLVLVGFGASAQVNLDRQTAFSDKSYTTSQKDTSSSYRLAGANLLSLVIFTDDTIAADVYVDYSTDLTTWSAKLTDSVKVADGAETVSEYGLRDSDSDALDAMYGYIRLRVAQRATGTAVAGTYTARFYFRP